MPCGTGRERGPAADPKDRQHITSSRDEQKRLRVTAEPRGRVYKNLLGEGLRHLDQFLFVDVPEPAFGPNALHFGRAPAIWSDSSSPIWARSRTAGRGRARFRLSSPVWTC